MSKRSMTNAARVTKRLVFGGLIAAAAGCASDSDEASITWGTREHELRLGPGTVRAEYFRFERTAEETAWPPATGQIDALNRSRTRCADGTFADSCPIGRLQIDDGWIPSPSYIVHGRLQRDDSGSEAQEGVFIGEALWAEVATAEQADMPDAAFFRVSMSRFPCTTTSCPALRLERLNTGRSRLASELDTTRLGLPRDYLALIHQLVEEGELIVEGELERPRFQLWPRLTVSRVFVPSVVACTSDDECPADTWCRGTVTGGYVCEPYRGEGEFCGAEAGMETRCSFPSFCVFSNFPDVPAVCRAPCKGQCDVGTYCTSHGCLPTATCEIATDCLSQANEWERPDCPGYPSCEPVGAQALCVWHCGNPACVDLTDFRLAGCSESLGYGRYGDQCGEVVGCAEPGSGAPELSETLEECQTECL